jgi:hypothetical protein
MEFIKAEEFLKQPVEIQKVFIEWWKSNTSKGDLLINLNDADEIECVKEVLDNMIISFTDKSYEGLDYFDVIPLLVEGQLRQFIEDKTHCDRLILWNTYYSDGTYYHKVCFSKKSDFQNIELKKCKNLLEAYWKVVIQIAKEQTHE